MSSFMYLIALLCVLVSFINGQTTDEESKTRNQRYILWLETPKLRKDSENSDTSLHFKVSIPEALLMDRIQTSLSLELFVIDKTPSLSPPECHIATESFALGECTKDDDLTYYECPFSLPLSMIEESVRDHLDKEHSYRLELLDFNKVTIGESLETLAGNTESLEFTLFKDKQITIAAIVRIPDCDCFSLLYKPFHSLTNWTTVQEWGFDQVILETSDDTHEQTFTLELNDSFKIHNGHYWVVTDTNQCTSIWNEVNVNPDRLHESGMGSDKKETDKKSPKESDSGESGESAEEFKGSRKWVKKVKKRLIHLRKIILAKKAKMKKKLEKKEANGTITSHEKTELKWAESEVAPLPTNTANTKHPSIQEGESERGSIRTVPTTDGAHTPAPSLDSLSSHELESPPIPEVPLVEHQRQRKGRQSAGPLPPPIPNAVPDHRIPKHKGMPNYGYYLIYSGCAGLVIVVIVIGIAVIIKKMKQRQLNRLNAIEINPVDEFERKLSKDKRYGLLERHDFVI